MKELGDVGCTFCKGTKREPIRGHRKINHTDTLTLIQANGEVYLRVELETHDGSDFRIGHFRINNCPNCGDKIEWSEDLE